WPSFLTGLGLLSALGWGVGAVAGFALALVLQRGGEPGDLRGRSREQRGGLRQLRLEGTGGLGQQDLPALQIGETLDLVDGKRVAVHVAALDLQGVVVLRERLERLRRLDRLALDEGDGGRPDEQVVKPGDTRIGGGALDEGVLRDSILGTRAESATQLGELGYREAVELGDHRGRAGAEVFRQLRDGGHLVGLRHPAPPLLAGDRGRARGRRTPRGRAARGVSRARGAWQASSCCAGRPRLRGLRSTVGWMTSGLR